jgi:hypothetical protein
MSAEAYDRRSRIGISKGVNQMRIPSQSKPVTRGVSTSPAADSVGPSSIQCDLCMLACNQLSGIAKALCQAACNNTVC